MALLCLKMMLMLMLTLMLMLMLVTMMMMIIACHPPTNRDSQSVFKALFLGDDIADADGNDDNDDDSNMPAQQICCHSRALS